MTHNFITHLISESRFRVWLAVKLIILAARILGYGNIEVVEPELNKYDA